MLAVCGGVSNHGYNISRWWEVFGFYVAESSLFWLGTVYVMGNLSDIVDLLILSRFDALFGCERE